MHCWSARATARRTSANARIVAQSIARYVVRCEDARKGVIIGYDHRFASDAIAAAVAEVLSASGTPVFLTDKPCPTPAVSLLVRQRAAAGGLMITASHNPYQWNGIKYKAIYRDGTFVNPHQIFALLVWHLAGTRNLPGDIAKTFSVTKLIDKLAVKFGRRL